MPPNNPMTEGEALAVDAVAKAIADVVGHGMSEKCEAQARAAIAALTAHTAASGGEVKWPARMVNLPCPEGTGDRIIGFRVPDGDPILGDYGLSEPLAWFRKVTIDRVAAPPAAVSADALERLRSDMMDVVSTCDDIGLLGAYVIGFSNRIAALIPKGADHEQR